jgi:hypothetical protein
MPETNYFPEFSNYLPTYNLRQPAPAAAPLRSLPADVPATGTGDWLSSALGAGFHGLLSEGARAAQAGAQLVGATDTAQSLSDFAEAHHAAEQSYARPDLEDSWSPTAIAYKIARMVPQGLAIAGGTLAGAALAPEAAAGAGVAALARAALVRRLAGTAGAAVTLFPSAAGENVQRQISETGELTSPGTALALGVPEAAVQAWLPGHLEKYFGRSILRGIAHSAAAQGFAGGATEFMTQQMGDPDRSFADRASAIVSQTLAGGALGGLVGGAFGGVRALTGKPANEISTPALDAATRGVDPSAAPVAPVAPAAPAAPAAAMPAEPAAPTAGAPVVPAPEMPRGEPAAPAPAGEPVVGAPASGEPPAAAAPVPVLDFTKGAVKAGGTLYEAASPEDRAKMHQPLMDEIIARAAEGKEPTPLQKRWADELDIWGELEKAVPKRLPEVPPGVTPEAPPTVPEVAAPAAGFTAFHGSPEDFTEFSPGKLGSIDLATDPAIAQRYSQARRPSQKEGAGNLYQVHVNAEPGEFLNIDNSEAGQRWDALVAEKGPVEASKQLQKEGYAGVSRDHGVYSLFDETRAQITHKNGEEIGPKVSPARDVPVKTADDRAAALNAVQAQIAKLSDPEAQAQHTAEAETIAKQLPLAEGNPGLVPKLNDRIDNLRAAVEAAGQRPADHVASPDLAPSPHAEGVPALTGDLDVRLTGAQQALNGLRKALGDRKDAVVALDQHEQWLKSVRDATGPEDLRKALAANPEADPDADNISNFTQLSKPMAKQINAYLARQQAVLQELRYQTGSYARVITSRDGLPVTQLDADVTDHAQRGVSAVDAADHLIEHTPNPEDAALVAKLRAVLPEDVKLVFRDGVTDKEGEYFPKQKTIAIYNAADAAKTFIHEMTHAVTHEALEGDSAAAEAVRGIYDQLKSSGDHAGITDAHEMVAEAFSNPIYRDYLRSKFVKGTSLWDRFVNTVRGFISLDPRLYNAFDRIMSLGDDLMKEQQQYPNDWVGPDSYARVANRGTEAAANGADQAQETLFQQVKDWRDGKGLNMRDAIRRGALAGFDGHRLGELWGSDVKSMRSYVAVLSKEDTRKGALLKGSQKGQDLANTLTDDGRTLLNKALTATFNGIDPRKPATIEVSENPVLSAVHQDLAGAYKRLISMPNGEAAYEALRANMSTYHNIGLLDKLQALERGLSGYTAPDRMNTFDQRTDLHTDPVKTERFFIDAVKNASDSLTAHREQLANQQATVDQQIKAGGVSTDDMKKLVEQGSGLKSDIVNINNVLKDVASQRDATAKSPYFHIGRHGNNFVTAKLALDPDGGAVDQEKLAKFIEHLDNNGFADIAPMLGGKHDTFYARVKNVSEMSQLEQVVRDAQKQGLLSPDKGSIGSGEATRVFGSIASDSMRKAIEEMKANRPEVPEGVDPDAFNKAFGKQIADMQRTLLDMTSENSASRLLAQRKNVQGFDQNMIKSQRDAAMTMSSHLARMTTAWEKGELMANMRDEVRDLNHSDADANTKVGASQAVGEFMLRDALRSAYVPSNPVDVARHITHTWAVGSSPAYFLMLMSQVATTALPELYKTHGIAAVPALLKAMPRTMKIISAMARSPDRFNADITDDILKAGGVDQPTIDETMGNVARGKLVPAYSMAQTEHSLPTGGVTRTVVQAADALGKYAELIPRLIVSYAARDLYNKSGGYEHPLLGKMTADQFVDRNIVESQGEWAGNLAPRYTSARGGFFGAATPMIDQFMGWQLRMSGKLYQEVQGMFDERTRPEATRWLIGHGAATTMLAGTLGLPLLSVAASVYDRLMDWVTNRDDHDLTASYRGFLSDTFGKDMGEIIARGLPRAAGMDFEHFGEANIFPGSSAINILFEKRKFEDAERDWAKSMAGAGIGEMANAYLAARDMFNGDYLNGLIKIAPEIIKAPAEAWRLHERGFVNNLTGQKLPISGPNAFDIMMTALGIDPAKQAEYQEVTREETGLRIMRQLNSSNIVRHLEQAYMRGDRGMLNTWMAEAQKWQVDHPGLMPPQADFQRELETHIRASAQAQGMGLPIGVTPRDVGARGALRYGNFPVQ